MSRIGVYAGSFDPITKGHIDIIERAFSIVDVLVIGIGVSASKKSVFSFEERRGFILECLGDKAKKMGVKLEVKSFDNLVVDFATEVNATIMIRGLRSVTDFDYEVPMAAMNKAMRPNIETVFLAATPEVASISSTLVRQIAAMGGNVKKFVPANVAKGLKNRF